MLNIVVGQINTTVGDLKGNTQKMAKISKEYAPYSHLIVFPELSVSGYPPEDLLLRLDFADMCQRYVESFLKETKDVDAVIAFGTPYYDGDLYNSLVACYRGQIVGIYKKSRLPNYSVFDEKRYFNRGSSPFIIELNGVKIAFSICEDIWHPDGVERLSALSGAEVIVNVNASPFHIGKPAFREGFVRARAEDNICFVVYVNMVGGNDELVFDGRSMVVDPLGRILARAKAYDEDVLGVTLDTSLVSSRRLLDLRLRDAVDSSGEGLSGVSFAVNIKKEHYFEERVETSPEGEEEIDRAIVLGTRDYVYKNGFTKAVLGLSGGIDSSLTACILVDALGKENVLGVFMPSRFSTQDSFEDARKLADNLDIEFHTIPIDDVYTSYIGEMVPVYGELNFDTADENIQARIRANILFYLSNRFGYVVISTSNKSEVATGYTTIYGDMAGGFAPLKDVYKSYIYKLAKYRNSISRVIPDRVFEKPPSAELRPDQVDQDTLPPYEVLDPILEMYIERCMSPDKIVSKGFDEPVVKKVVDMLLKAEYKRKQAPVGIKLTPRAFGKDWRMPITNKFKG